MKWTRYSVAFLVVLFLVGISGKAVAFPEKVMDDRKKEIDVQARPARIVSLAPTSTELLFALGLDKEIVGDTTYCDYPEAAKEKEKVGGFADIDVDRVAGLKPDLVLAFGTVQLPVVDELEKRGLKVFWFYPRSLHDILDCFERVGRITGRVAEAKQLRDRVEQSIDILHNALGDIPEEKRPTIFRVMGFDRAATIGAASFQNDLFKLAGGRNAFPAPGKDYVEMDARELWKLEPDILLVCGEDEKELKQKLRESPVYGNLNAVKKGRILVMSCDFTCRPGPRIAEAALRLAHYLHPESKITISEQSPDRMKTGTNRRFSHDCGCAPR